MSVVGGSFARFVYSSKCLATTDATAAWRKNLVSQTQEAACSPADNRQPFQGSGRWSVVSCRWVVRTSKLGIVLVLMVVRKARFVLQNVQRPQTQTAVRKEKPRGSREASCSPRCSEQKGWSPAFTNCLVSTALLADNFTFSSAACPVDALALSGPGRATAPTSAHAPVANSFLRDTVSLVIVHSPFVM